MLTHYAKIKPFITKDGSEIRELMHPGLHGNRFQSLAEASVNPGKQTFLHRHKVTEEIYHITHGQGMMRLGDDIFSVATGDSIIIAPGTPHNILNNGDQVLKILCCCSPAYSDSDTEIISEEGGTAIV